MADSSDAPGGWSPRPLWVALAAYGTGSVALGVLGVVAAVDLYDRSGSAAWATAVAVCRVAPFVVLSPVAGALASRHQGRALVTAAASAQLVAAGLLVASVGRAPLVSVAAVVLVAHAVWTVSYPSMAAMVPTLVPPSRLQQANGWATTVESLAWIAGPGIGGLALATIGARGAMVVAALSAATAVALWSARAPQRAAGDTCLHETGAESCADRLPDVADVGAPGLLAVIRDATQRLREPSVAGAVVLHLVDNAAMGAVSVLLVVVAPQLGFDSGGYGALSAALAAGSFVSLVVLRRLGSIDRPIVALAAAVLVAGAPVAALAVVRAPAPALVLVTVTGVGSMLVEVLAITIVQRSVPVRSLAPVLGVLDSLVIGAILVGSLICAPLVALVGPERALVIVGAVVPAVAVAAVPAFRWGRGEALTAVSVAELAVALPATAIVRPPVRLQLWADGLRSDVEPTAAADDRRPAPVSDDLPDAAAPEQLMPDRRELPDRTDRSGVPPTPITPVIETDAPGSSPPAAVFDLFDELVPVEEVPGERVPGEEDVLGLVPVVPVVPVVSVVPVEQDVLGFVPVEPDMVPALPEPAAELAVVAIDIAPPPAEQVHVDPLGAGGPPIVEPPDLDPDPPDLDPPDEVRNHGDPPFDPPADTACGP